MAPAATQPESNSHAEVSIKTKTLPGARKPIQYSGSLDKFESFDVTPVIGEEFPKLQLSEILADDEKVRDLAVLGKFLNIIL